MRSKYAIWIYASSSIFALPFTFPFAVSDSAFIQLYFFSTARISSCLSLNFPSISLFVKTAVFLISRCLPSSFFSCCHLRFLSSTVSSFISATSPTSASCFCSISIDAVRPSFCVFDFPYSSFAVLRIFSSFFLSSSSSRIFSFTLSLESVPNCCNKSLISLSFASHSATFFVSQTVSSCICWLSTWILPSPSKTSFSSSCFFASFL